MPDPTNAAPFPMPTTFLSFTPNGGRLGRIAWDNDSDSTWGHVRWDRWWPRNPPSPAEAARWDRWDRWWPRKPQTSAEAAKAAAILGRTMKRVGVSVQQATEAIRALAAAMAKADA